MLLLDNNMNIIFDSARTFIPQILAKTELAISDFDPAIRHSLRSKITKVLLKTKAGPGLSPKEGGVLKFLYIFL